MGAIMVGTKEHYDLLDHFERTTVGRFDREEDKALWKIGAMYQCGETNEKYKAFISGYAYGKSVYKAT